MEVLRGMNVTLQRLIGPFRHDCLTTLCKVREPCLVFWIFLKVEIKDFVELEYILPKNC